MIGVWILYASAVGALVALAAHAFDGLARIAGWNRRVGWALGVAAAVVLPAILSMREPARLTPLTTLGEPLAVDTVSLPKEPASGSSVPVNAYRLRAALAPFDVGLSVVWGMGSVALVIVYLGASRLLRRRRRHWSARSLEGVPVAVSEDTGPAVIGALRPVIVVPQWSLGLPPNDLRLMLAHEQEHVRANDPLLIHVVSLGALLMPWNLAIWWMLKRLRVAVELDCDRRVLRAGRDREHYGSLLLSVCARRAHRIPLVAPALLERHSTLSLRIHAMYAHRPRLAVVRAITSSTIALSLVVLACEMPTPEMLAPDGKDQEVKVLYGEKAQETERVQMTEESLRALMAKHHPDVLEREVGPTTMVFILDDDQSLVSTGRVSERRLEDRTRQLSKAMSALPRKRLSADESVNAEPNPMQQLMQEIPKSDIASVEVVKRAAMRLGPNAISVIWITLKPGAKLPADAPR
jgi:hypothetical protein